METQATHRASNGFSPEIKSSVWHVAPQVGYLQNLIVNVCFVGEPGATGDSWVLVDAGLPLSAQKIRQAAEQRFGAGTRPAAILLTHGHFDHVGSLEALAERWDVPVYAHSLELPYLTGQSSYPPPDPTVDGGAMARLSFLYPKGPIDLGGRVQELPAGGEVPGLPDWRWIHTPGHAPGHVSFFREADRTLIAGDAFVTVKQESALAVLTQKKNVHAPPAYFTPDWQAAHRSVRRLAEARPRVATTGHGRPMHGDRLQRELGRLAGDFERLGMPARGRYVGAPAQMDRQGVVSVPPAPRRATGASLGMGAALAAGAVLAFRWWSGSE